MASEDVNDVAYVPEAKVTPANALIAQGSMNPFTLGTGTYAVSTSPSTPINLQILNAIWLHSFSIIPLSSTISIAFYFRYGNWSVGNNPPAVNTGLTIAGFAFNKSFEDGTGRYPQLNAGDTLQLIVIANGSGYVTVDITGEYAQF